MPIHPKDFAPKHKSFADRVLAPRPSDIVLVRGNDTTGQEAWYYFRIGEHKRSAFDRKAKQKNMNLADYGTILFSGYGKNPPADMIEKMKQEFGFEEAN